MKSNNLLFLCFLLLASFGLSAQEVKFGDLDKSPMDAAHYPTNSAYLNYLDEDDPNRTRKIKVLYSRPQKKGRTLFGDLIPFGKDWRFGANEASEITFYQAVGIGGERVPAGTYTMFVEPVSKDKWTFKLSKERFIGGSQDRDVSMDIASAPMKVSATRNEREFFTIGFQEIDDRTVHLVSEWGNTRAALPINLSPAYLAKEDASPMDLIQYPDMSRLRNFVKKEELDANKPQVRVVYSRPTLKGRKAFGNLIKNGKMWRVGANETTELTFFNDVMIGDKKVEAGQYGLFAKVNEGEWEFILHTATQSWGHPNFDEEKTVLKYKSKTEKTPKTLEALSMTFVEVGDNTIHLVIGWEDTMARLPIKLMK